MFFHFSFSIFFISLVVLRGMIYFNRDFDLGIISTSRV